MVEYKQMSSALLKIVFLYHNRSELLYELRRVFKEISWLLMLSDVINLDYQGVKLSFQASAENII